ncbi:MAG: ATP-dependent DNA helicase [Methanomassiliicoccales archaeon PtaU1.Bin124]|nr:MAG: ATP-dependent DNA helicase [Methanomassiliicoccales archaeon PtaU1.Bin124]
MEAHEPFPLTPAIENGLFPFAQVREGQRQFLDDARSCVANKVHLLAHAPTGIGKTAVALAAALETTQESGVTFFLTARQSQHNAAVETARYIWRRNRMGVIDIISREDSCLCNKPGGKPPCMDSQDCYFLEEERIEKASRRLLEYPLHVTEAQRLCLRLGACPYLAARKAVPMAQLVVADFNQAFSLDCDLMGASGHKTEEMVLVVDEAHNLPGRIMENRSALLQRSTAHGAFRSTGNRTFKAGLKALIDHLDRSCFERTAQLPIEGLDAALIDACGLDAASLGQQIREHYRNRIRRSVDEVADFLLAWSRDGDRSVRFADPGTGTLHVRYLEPGIIASAVMDQCRCAIMMSGTLHPPEMFADLLGIRDVAVCRRYTSPFPKENRLILVDDSVTSRFDRRDDSTYAAMAERLDLVCRNVPGNVLAFLPSYDFLSKVEANLTSTVGKKVLSERKGMAKAEKDALLMSLRGERPCLLLATASGSFAEGVDVPDNLIASVVVAGLPLSPPSIESEELMARMSGRHGGRKAMMYVRIYPAITKVLQAAGRAIRSETDRASIVLLDERYLGDAVRAGLPSDFVPQQVDDIGAALRQFHGEHQHQEGSSDEPIGNIIT